ncbi:DNA polymerase III subunit alpha [Scatolibacter rhodanostii]|uniref:DNA polymerase III subunit alpha n=1 Tax=Scatolibacter rhodanostii TaxID=2014781 RepID=UPI000C07C238|nr:DNA polymerase III subunit alpha [Scatolibacter rhodanostii]
MGFAHLHLHTEFSLLDGACRIEKVLDAAKQMGQTAVAITDHGVMYGVVDFYKAAKKRGIKPIIGSEVYVAKRSRFDKTHEFDYENRHLVLLCENEIGYQNLIYLVSHAWTEGFYNKPRVDLDLLAEHHDGLIALSACLAGEVSRALSRNDYEEAKTAALRYQTIFGKDNFFLELQDHGLPEQKHVNPQIIRLSKETEIPLVVTNDCHYIRKEDSKMHHILVCIQTNRTIEDEDTLEFGSDEFYFKSEEEMRALFPSCPEAADNTARIAERCQVDFEFGHTKLPAFTTPDGSDNKDFFIRECYAGLVRHYGEKPDPKITERLQYEISTIEQMGYINYFLIVYDFIHYAKSRGISVGPGRGSGVGSIAAYCLGITGVDPLRYDLIFERFLNPERVSMPDFDIDFSDERRQEIIDYVVDKYGADHVAQIVTFGTMAARGALRDVGRALAIPYAKVDMVAKLVPMELGMTLEKALKISKEFRSKYEEDSQVQDLIDMALQLEGMPRHASTHAAGVVITDKPVMEYVPLAKNDESVVTQFTMTTIEELGLLKMDFLGLRNLSVIDNASVMIRQKNPSFSIEMIPDDDPAAYTMIASGATEGVFQFESAGMRRLIMQSKPSQLEDLIAIISLYRPGPMQFIPTYIQNRKDPTKVRYLHEKLRHILDVTFGCIIYQEQVMQIFRDLAGYSLGRADIVRRAMSKKKHRVLEKEKQVFLHGLKREDGTYEIDGCLRRGVDEKTAEILFGEIQDFASYAFNKSHAAAYAVVAYQTAYLKCHYPYEYMAALLTSVLGFTSKVTEYMEECTRLSIAVLPPHVNYSLNEFTVVGESIRFGLLAIKNLGRNVILRLIEERRLRGNFVSFYDFCERMQGKELNKRALESLIRCGALDDLGNNRKEMLSAVSDIMDSLEADKRRNLEGQIGFFDTLEDHSSSGTFIPSMPDFSHFEKLSMEKEVAGMYLSGHPMAEYRNLYQSAAVARLDEVLLSSQGESDRYHDEQRIRLLGIITSVRKKITKSNSTMAFATIEDMFGSLEMLIFPAVLDQFNEQLAESKIVSVTGRLSFTEEQEPKLLCDSVEDIQQFLKNTEKTSPNQTSVPKAKAPAGLYLKVPAQNSAVYQKALQYIEVFDGRSDVYIRFADSGKLLKAPAKYRVDINDVLVGALRELLGENLVAVIKN